jgi:hypothetical protein
MAVELLARTGSVERAVGPSPIVVRRTSQPVSAPVNSPTVALKTSGPSRIVSLAFQTCTPRWSTLRSMIESRP